MQQAPLSIQKKKKQLQDTSISQESSNLIKEIELGK